MASNKNNWQDFAKDLGLSFEIDPNAPELPPEPEVVVVETVVAAEVVVCSKDLDTVTAETVVADLDTDTGSEVTEEPGEPKRRRRVRKRRGPREETDEANEANEGNDAPEGTLLGDGENAEGRELVSVGAPDNEFQSAVGENLVRHHRHHRDEEESPEDEEPFVLEDLSNLSLPNWTELIDSLYRPER